MWILRDGCVAIHSQVCACGVTIQVCGYWEMLVAVHSWCVPTVVTTEVCGYREVVVAVQV